MGKMGNIPTGAIPPSTFRGRFPLHLVIKSHYGALL